MDNELNAVVPVKVSLVDPPPKKYNCRIEFDPSPTEMTLQPKSVGTVKLTVHIEKRSWWRRRKFSFHVEGEALPNEALSWDEDKVVKVLIHPKIPIWLNLLFLFLLMGLGYYLSWMNPYTPLYYHKRAINSVEFNGRGTDFVSGSDDTQVIEWELEGFQSAFVRPDRQEIATTERQPGNRPDEEGRKAVRVVRYRPQGNDKVAVGLENGVIQIWDLPDASKQPEPDRTLAYDRADRVLDLQFAPDSRTLYSAHGRGALIQWRFEGSGQAGNFPESLASCPGGLREDARALDRALQGDPAVVRARKLDFAIYSLAWVGEDREFLAVAGEKNQLVLTDPSLERCQPIPYGQGGTRDDYITALAAARAGGSKLLASADNRGTIAVWQLGARPGNPNVPVEVALVDRWQAGESGSPSPAVRAIALSEDGCYLASGGDDGRVMLWPLNANGKRAKVDGVQLFPRWWGKRSRKIAVNSLDIQRAGDTLSIISATDESQVRLFTQEIPDDSDRQCR